MVLIVIMLLLVLLVLIAVFVLIVLMVVFVLMSRVCQGVIALTEAWACAPDERRTSGTLGLVYDTDLNRCPKLAPVNSACLSPSVAIANMDARGKQERNRYALQPAGIEGQGWST